MKRVLPVLILLLAFGFGRLIPTVEAADNGVISGRVINGTAGAPVPQGLSVKLAAVTPSGAATDKFQTRTQPVADDGTFRFEGLPVTNEFAYVATVEYQGVPYVGEAVLAGDTEPSQVLQLTDAQPSLDVSMKVYEVTAEDPGLKVMLEHMIIEPAPPVLWVLDVVNLNNPSDRAYTGKPGPAGGPPVPLHFSLPANAASLNPMTGLDPSRLALSGDGFDSQSPVLPGLTSVAFMYAVPYDGDTLSFQRMVTLPTDRMTVLFQDVGAKVQSPQFTNWEQTTQNDQPYLRSSFSGAAPGSIVAIDFSDLPKAAAVGGGGGGSDRTPLIVGGVGVLAALALLGLYLRLRGQLAAVGATPPAPDGPGEDGPGKESDPPEAAGAGLPRGNAEEQ